MVIALPFWLVGALIVWAFGIRTRGPEPEEMTLAPSAGRRFANFDVYDTAQRYKPI